MDKSTPTLEGEDARRFVENMRKAEQSPASQEEIDRIIENTRKFTQHSNGGVMTFEEWRDVAAKNESEAMQGLLRVCWAAAFMAGKKDIKEQFIKLSSALSHIDYIIGEPNDMELSIYDLDYDPSGVVERVKKFIASATENKQAAFRSGQEEARENAAYACDRVAEVRASEDAKFCADLIRLIEIKEG